MRRLPLVILAFSTAAALVAAKPAKGPAPAAPVPDSTIGLSRTSVFSVPAPPAIAKAAAEPGTRPRLPRAFAGSPPALPPGVAEFLPITRARHACLECHDRPNAAEVEAVPVPASHYRDLRQAPAVERQTIAGARYVCVSCHVPQTEAPPLVGNRGGR